VRAIAIFPDGIRRSHYFNRVNNKDMDFTRSQFPKNTIMDKVTPKLNRFATTRDYILSYPQTQERYEILKRKVKTALG
jgi:hypothetical protein